MLTLYDYRPSGNGYKVRMLLARLGLAYRYVEVDILKGDTRAPEFLKINPAGRIPALILEDGTALPESNAILWYLAEGTPWLPASRLGRAQALRWMFFEQYEHEPRIAVRRFILHYLPDSSPRRAELPALLAKGHAALAVLEQGLEGRDWLVGDRPSIADLSLYGYTHTADEGGYDLAGYPNIRAWLARIAAQPGHTPITAT
jgi:glutathione S-transferase